jgi:hypothetical protein
VPRYLRIHPAGQVHWLIWLIALIGENSYGRRAWTQRQLGAAVGLSAAGLIAELIGQLERLDTATPRRHENRRGVALVCGIRTGGRAPMQLDAPLVQALHAERFEIAIETNGTRLPPPGIDWVCVSPKAGAEFVLWSGDELKLVYPQDGAEPTQFEGLAFDHFLLSPMDGPERERNTRLAVQYCLDHPHWRLNLQTQNYLDIR